MKKILLTLVAVMTMSFANAETEGFRTHRHVVEIAWQQNWISQTTRWKL